MKLDVGDQERTGLRANENELSCMHGARAHRSGSGMGWDGIVLPGGAAAVMR